MKLFKRETYQTYSDHQLMEKYQTDHSQRAINVLYLRYEHVVKLLCRKYLTVHECKDVVSVVFEKFLKQIQKEIPTNIGGWIYMVSKNTCLQELRDKKKESSIEFEAQAFEAPESQKLEAYTEADLNYLSLAMEQLNKDQATCIKLFYLEEKTYKAITECTNYSLKEVKSYLQNGRRNLMLIVNQLKKEAVK